MNALNFGVLWLAPILAIAIYALEAIRPDNKTAPHALEGSTEPHATNQQGREAQ